MDPFAGRNRYYGVLIEIRFEEQLLFVVTGKDDGETRVLALADTVLRDEVPEAEVRALLEPALQNVVEVEERAGSSHPTVADIWYPEPIIEDEEVEYTAPLHLRTLLVRAGLAAWQ